MIRLSVIAVFLLSLLLAGCYHVAPDENELRTVPGNNPNHYMLDSSHSLTGIPFGS